MTKQPILAITSGEPAGIGVDICLDLPDMDLPCRVVVLGDAHLLQKRADCLRKSIKIREFNPFRQPEKNTIDVQHIPLRDVCVAGQLNPQNSPYVIELLDTAMNGIENGVFSGMVTAPVHKGVINQFYGETMYFS